MDNKNINPQNEDWLDEILGKKDSVSEIGVDEQAVSAAGLTHPEDAELEKILQEANAWDAPRKPEPAFPDPDSPDYYGEPEAPAPQPKPRPARKKEPVERKGRPAPKKGSGLWGIPHLLATVVWLAIAVAIGVSLGRVIWVCAADVLAFGKPSNEITITITDSDDIDSVSEKLANAELVRYPGLFKLFADLTGKGEAISSGTYTLRSDLDYNAMINFMSGYTPALVDVELMIPEGYNCAQIFELLEKEGVCTVAELESYAADGELDDYWFLDGVERGHKYCLEGYLFPDTYQFYIDDEPERVLEKFLDNFDYRFTDRMKQDFKALNARFGGSLTVHDVVIMASIVEKESAGDDESYNISSVFYNRLAKSSEFPFLNSDATLLYDEEYRSAGLLITDTQKANSPYNTYTQIGLPAGPIANPGANSLYAALTPSDTDYYYFVYDEGAKVHRFSRTYSEHVDWCNRLGL